MLPDPGIWLKTSGIRQHMQNDTYQTIHPRLSIKSL